MFPVPVYTYAAYQVRSVEHETEITPETLVGKTDPDAKWEVIGFTATEKRGFVLLGKRPERASGQLGDMAAGLADANPEDESPYRGL